jgi:hypothetical protein
MISGAIEKVTQDETGRRSREVTVVSAKFAEISRCVGPMHGENIGATNDALHLFP